MCIACGASECDENAEVDEWVGLFLYFNLYVHNGELVILAISTCTRTIRLPCKFEILSDSVYQGGMWKVVPLGVRWEASGGGRLYLLGMYGLY